MNFESFSILLFLGAIGVLAFIDRKNIEMKYVILIRRTQKGKETIKRLAKKHEKFLTRFADVSIIAAFIVSIVGLLFLFRFPGVRFMFPKVFPGEPSEAVQQNAFFIPIWYWVIAIFVIITPHELSHGLLAAIEKIRINSLGVVLFLIFPGAFVEPDEEQFQKSKPLTKMRVAAVGSMANLVVFVLLMIMVFGLGKLGSVMFDPKGVQFENTIPNTPADDVGLKGVITGINDQEIKDAYDLSEILDSIKPGERIKITTTKGEYELKTIEHPDNASRSYIGIGNISTKLDYTKRFMFLGNPETGANVYIWFTELFGWIAFLDLNVAVANLLPFLPFDGGVIWQALFEKFFKKKQAQKMIMVLSVITYGVLILNLVGGKNILKLFGG